MPAPFEMDHLDPDHPQLTGLTGRGHRGHFERHAQDGGAPIGRASATLVDTVLFRPFRQGPGETARAGYLLFGKGPSCSSPT